MNASPFVAVLGERLDQAAPGIHAHFAQADGTRLYRGTLPSVWRRSGWLGRLATPFLRLGSTHDTLFVETGSDVPFELENAIIPLPDGRQGMTWSRRFFFPGVTRRFEAVMVFDARRGIIVDRLGRWGHLAVELYARIEQESLAITSGRQWLSLGFLRLPLPRWFAGEARVREWQQPDGTLGISVTVYNPLLGEFFGYRGSFAPVEQPN